MIKKLRKKTINIIKPHKEKYHALYWQIAKSAAAQSVAVNRQVGAAIVTTTGIVAIGWNGTPAGLDNSCEYSVIGAGNVPRLKTKPEVIHAEINAINKLVKSKLTTVGSILFTTTAPCMNCAKSIETAGISHVYYIYDFHGNVGIDFLISMGVITEKYLKNKPSDINLEGITHE